MRSFAFVMVVPLLASAAWAQSPSTSTPSGQSATSEQGQADQQQQMHAQQQVQKNLEQAGFTDITIVPRSFLVRAKDKEGNQTMMFITPSSVTAIRKIPGSTTGQGGSPSQGGQGGSGNQDKSPEASPSGK